MFIYLLFLFTVVPLVELVILIRIGQYIGTFNTILIVVITGIIGASLAKYQGLKVVIRIRKEIASGQLPAGTLFDGLLIFIAGILLITPGLLTDCLGFALLTPPFRRLIKTYIRQKVEENLPRQRIHIEPIDYEE